MKFLKSIYLSLKNLIGFPKKRTIYEIANVLYRYRFMLFIYLASLCIYLIFLDNSRASDPTNFWLSFSASFLEDLITFVFLTVCVTFISIKISSIEPEDHAFDRRISALMNSSKMSKDEKANSYVSSKISELLTFNKTMKYEVTVLEYYKDDESFSIQTDRTHVVTNMCRDKKFLVQKAPIYIEVDQLIDGSCGMLNYIHKLDPNDLSKRLSIVESHQHFQAGVNSYHIDYELEGDSEVAFVVSYNCFSKVDEDSSKQEAWLYSDVIKFTSRSNFSIINKLKCKNDLYFSLRHMHNSDILNIKNAFKLTHNQKFEYPFPESLLPGERIEYYLYKIN